MFMRITTGLLVALAIVFPTVPASADEASESEVFSAPGVRSPVSAEGDPGSAQPRRAAKSTQTLGRTARHALVIDLGPLPIDLSPPAEEEDTGTVAPKRYRIGVHRPLPREFTGDLVPHLDWTADPDGRHTATITFRAAGSGFTAPRRASYIALWRIGPGLRWRRPAARLCLHTSGPSTPARNAPVWVHQHGFSMCCPSPASAEGQM